MIFGRRSGADFGVTDHPLAELLPSSVNRYPELWLPDGHYMDSGEYRGRTLYASKDGLRFALVWRTGATKDNVNVRVQLTVEGEKEADRHGPEWRLALPDYQAGTRADPPPFLTTRKDPRRWIDPSNGDILLRCVSRAENGREVWRPFDPWTGQMVDYNDPRVSKTGVWIGSMRGGQKYHPTDFRDTDLTAGTPLRLRREPENPYDPNAVAIDGFDGSRLGYVSRGKARSIAKMMDSGVQLECRSMRGTVPGIAHDRANAVVLIAEANLLHVLLSRAPDWSLPYARSVSFKDNWDQSQSG